MYSIEFFLIDLIKLLSKLNSVINLDKSLVINYYISMGKETTKICTRCKLDQVLSNFNIDNNTKDKHRYICKDCSKAIVYEKRGKVYISCKKSQEPSVAAPEKSEGLDKAVPTNEEHEALLEVYSDDYMNYIFKQSIR